MQKKRIGVIGVGHLGKFHVEKYLNIPDAQLTAVVDIDFDKAEKVAAEIGVTPYADYKEIIGKVDAVSIAVPTSSHFEIAKRLIKARIDVLIEKPVTVTVEEADKLIALAARKDVIIQVGHIERFNPVIKKTADIIKDPGFIEAHRLSFFKKRGVDVDVILDLMIHDIDITLNAVNSRIKLINSVVIPVISSNIDIANARIEFENGCAANLTASRVSKHDVRKIRFFQHNTYISLDCYNKSASIFKKTDEFANDLPVIDEVHMDLEKSDALYDELKAFVDCIITRKEPPVTAKAGRDALEVATRILDHINIKS